jgi:hypothetical protein
MKMKSALLVALAVLFVGTLSLGYGVGNTEAALIEQGTSHGVAYLSGGVGVGERIDLERVARDFNLKLVFAERSKPYLADVRVEIKDKSGSKLVDATADGPWFFVRLPEGRYQVMVDHAGKKEEKTVDVGTGLQTLNFVWKG